LPKLLLLLLLLLLLRRQRQLLAVACLQLAEGGLRVRHRACDTTEEQLGGFGSFEPIDLQRNLR
jgi:hypothetical protein